MAPTTIMKEPEDEDKEDKGVDDDVLLIGKHLHRVVEIVIASSTTSPKNINGFEGLAQYFG
jgi:hypothetical protein